jgi:transcriptional regulator with XRE-family HTH domain
VRFDKDRLRRARRDADLTQEELAAKTEISSDSVKRAERGEAVHPDTARAIGIALNINHEDLLLSPEQANSPEGGPALSGPLEHATSSRTNEPPAFDPSRGDIAPAGGAAD